MSKRIQKTIMCPNCWATINYDIEVEEEGSVVDAIAGGLDPLTGWAVRKLSKLTRKEAYPPIHHPYFCPNCNTFFY